MWYRLRSVIVAGAVLAALTACGDDDNGTSTGPDDDGQQQTATIVGSIESTVDASSSLNGFSLRTAASRTSGSAQASTVSAVAVSGDGSLQVLAEAEVQADGRFSIEDVPAGRSGLLVSARASSGEEVGRVLVHGETEGGATIVTEPVNGETTVEGLVLETLAEAGVDERIRNTAQLALLVRLDQSTAQEVAASAQSIQEVADAYRAGAEAQSQVFAGVGADQSAQADALIEAALQHAENRDGGSDPETAQEDFVQAALDAFAQGGADSDEIARATAAAATGLDQAGSVASEDARLDLARNAVELNLDARQELVAGLSSSEEASAAATALTDAEARVGASISVAEIAQALSETEASAREELTSMILSALPPEVPDDVRIIIEGRLDTAFAEADLSASLEGSVDVASIVQTAVDYRDRVRSAVEAFVAELPSGVSVSASVTTDLLVATQGGPAIGSGS